MRCVTAVLSFKRHHSQCPLCLLLSSQIKLFLLLIALVMVFCHSNGKDVNTKEVLVTASDLMLRPDLACYTFTQLTDTSNIHAAMI